MNQSSMKRLERRLESLERSPVLQPPPERPYWGDTIRFLAGVSLGPGNLSALQTMLERQEQGLVWVPDQTEVEALDAWKAALELEVRRAAFTDFAEYDRAYSELISGHIWFNDSLGVESTLVTRILDNRKTHGKPTVPHGWEIPEGWTPPGSCPPGPLPRRGRVTPSRGQVRSWQ